MNNQIVIDDTVLKRSPSLFVVTRIIEGVKVQAVSEVLQDRKEKIIKLWQNKTPDSLNSIPEVLAYRDLQKDFGLDPALKLPAVEAMLVRGVLQSKFPTINTAVDSANVISLENLIPIGLFDLDKIMFPAKLTLSVEGDQFVPIGKESPEKLKVDTPILKDRQKIFSSIGVRDSRDTMITSTTQNLLVLSWGTESVDQNKVVDVLRQVEELLLSL